MDASWLFPLRFDLRRARPNRIDVSTVSHPLLGEIKVVAVRIVGPEGGEGTVGRPPKYSDTRIIFLDACDCLFDVVDIDAEVMQPRDITGFSTDHRHTDITVADTDRVICPNRFFLFSRARLRSFHPEYRFVKLRFSHEVFTDNSEVLNPASHNRSLLRRPSTTVPSSRFNVQGIRSDRHSSTLNFEPGTLKLSANYLPCVRWTSAIRSRTCCLKSTEVGTTSDNACKCKS